VTPGQARDQADWLSWLELGGIRPRTLADYEWATARLLRMFPTKGLAEFTDGDIGHALRTFPPAGRRTKQAAYQSWFRWAKQTRRLTDNPMEYLPRQKRQPRKPVDVFTSTECAALEALPSPDGPLLALLLGTGSARAKPACCAPATVT
jgi:site-specific recombinase XerD